MTLNELAAAAFFGGVLDLLWFVPDLLTIWQAGLESRLTRLLAVAALVVVCFAFLTLGAFLFRRTLTFWSCCHGCYYSGSSFRSFSCFGC